MEMKFHYTKDEWDRGKAEMRRILEGVAARKDVTTYSELASKMTTIHIEAYGRPMDYMLGEIAVEDDASGRGLMTALVKHKTGDMAPGVGFYTIAEQLGRDTSDRDICWITELKRVHNDWANAQETK